MPFSGARTALSQLFLKQGLVTIDSIEEQQDSIYGIEIGAGIWIGYAGQPNILVTLVATKWFHLIESDVTVTYTLQIDKNIKYKIGKLENLLLIMNSSKFFN